MAYQASSSCSKEGLIQRLRVSVKNICIVVSIITIVTTTSISFADDPAPNPLTVDISISATVLQNPGVNPFTPPSSPGAPSNTNNIDAVIFRGIAYSSSTVSLLKNGIILAQIPTNQDGTFDIRVRNLDQGTYSFGLRAQDPSGLISKLLMFTVFVSPPVTTVVQGIFIPPTISSDKIEVKQGDSILFFGRSAPNAEVRLSVTSNGELLRKTKADGTGAWIYTMDSQELDLGDYIARARSLTASDTSPYSDLLAFRVGNQNRFRPTDTALGGFRKRCDLNDDGRVNLLDFSIMAFWYKRITFPPRVDLNDDARINLTDLSILAYCWTG